MIKESTIELNLDIAIHVLILFTFLTIFFFTYISKLEKDNLDKLTSDMITNNTKNILDNIQKYSKEYKYNVNWKDINDKANDILSIKDKTQINIDNNNKTLLTTSIIVIVVLFFVITAIVLYIKYVLKININITHILTMNAIIFGLTGLVEFLFFTFVASKYIPVTPDTVSNTILDRIKYTINEN
jgi:Ca2+/Na+ antiporter